MKLKTLDSRDFESLKQILKIVSVYWRQQLAVLFFTCVSALIGLIIPYISKFLVDNAIIKKNTASFFKIGTIGLITGLAGAVFSIFFSRFKMHYRIKIGFDIRRSALRSIERLPLSVFQKGTTADYLFRINDDISKVVNFISSVPEELMSICVNLLCIICMVFYLDWQMALFSISMIAIASLPTRLFRRRMRKIDEHMWGVSQHAFSKIGELFSHMYLVKALRKEREEINKYLKAQIVTMRMQIKKWRFETVYGFVAGSIGMFTIGAISMMGSYQVIRGRISAGTLTAIMVYLSRISGLQQLIAGLGRTITDGFIHYDRVRDILNDNNKAGKNNTQKRDVALEYPRIEFKGATFGYLPEEQVISNLSFTIEKGFVALVGLSGCGKTTILNLMLNLYEPREGQILLGGRNVNTLDNNVFRKQVSVALQEPFLWNDTIENNIRYGHARATKAEVLDIARIAGVDDFARSFPEGYNTVAGENACRFSDGQKQKIAIARALLKNPRILILDEATSSMDAESEQRVLMGIRTLPIDTIIIVSHRLSSIRTCDRVYYLKHGNQVIEGTFDELLKNDESFYALFAPQLYEQANRLESKEFFHNQL